MSHLDRRANCLPACVKLQTNKNRKDSLFQSARRSTRMITLGHGFGGLIVYSAISQSMVSGQVKDAGDPSKDPVDGCFTTMF